MFTARDLALRRTAALLPSRAGYALTRRLTPVLGGDRLSWIGSVVEEKAREVLQDEELARQAGTRFATEIAYDDLDAFTSVAWSETRRLGSTRVVGDENLPASGPAVVTSFHLSGGFRIFDVLRSRGLRPVFLHVPPRGEMSAYDRAVGRARTSYFEQHLTPPFVEPGPGARDQLDAHLESGGVAVALLDVEPSSLGLRDHVECSLFGRPLRLPVGLLRLAAKHTAPVTTYFGRVEKDAREIELRPSLVSSNPEDLLRRVLAECEAAIRERPWTWQSWLDLERLFA